MNSSGWLPEFRCLSEEISRFLPGATCTMTPGGSLPLSRCIQNTTNSRRQPLREIIMLRLEVIQILQYSHALIASQGARSSIWSRLNSFRILCLLSGWFTNSHNRNISEIIDNLSQREIITETGLRSVNTLGVFGIFLTVRNDGGLRVLLSGLCYVGFELNCSTARNILFPIIVQTRHRSTQSRPRAPVNSRLPGVITPTRQARPRKPNAETGCPVTTNLSPGCTATIPSQ